MPPFLGHAGGEVGGGESGRMRQERGRSQESLLMILGDRREGALG